MSPNPASVAGKMETTLMRAIVEFDLTGPNDQLYLTWSPLRATIRLVDADTAQPTQDVQLRNAGAAGGGRLVFATAFAQPEDETLALRLATDGTPRPLWVAGAFQSPSTAYGDAGFEVVDAGGTVIGGREAMVRIRKDAMALTVAERDRFLTALADLNDAGAGPFRAFRDMHVRLSSSEAHGAAGFLPWHRAYLLDLERSLQALDPTVTLPYWRFDAPAPQLFAPDFLGSPAAAGGSDQVIFPPGHPLEFWTTDGVVGITRRARWDVALAPTTDVPFQGITLPAVLTEPDTFDLGGPSNRYAGFRRMETTPHGAAHVRFSGPIGAVPTAARDPLFFLLHANVDRLWARWQWLHRRSNADDPDAYSVTGTARPDGGGTVGHRLNDNMWPWNQETQPPRPAFPPPRPGFPASPAAARPDRPDPQVRDMVDFHGLYSIGNLGFGYDDVPFEIETMEPVA